MTLWYSDFGVQLISDQANEIQKSKQKKTLPLIVVAGILALVLFFFIRRK